MINYKKHLTKGCFSTKGNRTKQFNDKYMTNDIKTPFASNDFVKLLCKDINDYADAIGTDEYKMTTDSIEAILDVSPKYFMSTLSENIASIYIDPITKTLIHKIHRGYVKDISYTIPANTIANAIKLYNQIDITRAIAYNYNSLLEYMTEFIKVEHREYSSPTTYTTTVENIRIEEAEFIVKKTIKGTTSLKNYFKVRHDMQLYRILDKFYLMNRVDKYLYLHKGQTDKKRSARYYINDVY